MSNKQYTEFENLIQDSLNNYEVEYDASQWDKLEKELPSSGSGYTKYLLLGAAACLITAGIYFFQTKTKTQNQLSTNSKNVDKAPVNEETVKTNTETTVNKSDFKSKETVAVSEEKSQAEKLNKQEPETNQLEEATPATSFEADIEMLKKK